MLNNFKGMTMKKLISLFACISLLMLGGCVVYPNSYGYQQPMYAQPVYQTQYRQVPQYYGYNQYNQGYSNNYSYAQPRYYQNYQQPNVVGGVIGGVAGGVLGSTIGRGNGRIAATGVGAALGAIIGSGMH
jgi:outer membrane lipoprotein SlyB